MPLETNTLMSFLQQVEDARRQRQQAAQEQVPATPEMPEWSKRLNPDDFTGQTREMLLKAQAAGPLHNPVGRGGGEAQNSDLVDRGGGAAQIYNPVGRMRGGAGADELMGGIRVGDPHAPGTANQMGKGDLGVVGEAMGTAATGKADRLMPQQLARDPVVDGINRVMEEERQRQPVPAPIDPGVMRDPNRPQQPAQRQMPEPAAQMPQQQNAAPAAPQGGQPVNLRKALGPHVGGPGDFVQMAQRARRTGEMPGGGRAPVSGSGGSDTLAGGPTPARGGGLFGGSGPGLGYMIGGIGSLLQEASGQTGAAGKFAQTYGAQLQEQRLSNQTRQLAIDYGVDPQYAMNAPIEVVNKALGEKYNERNAGPQYSYHKMEDGTFGRLNETTGEFTPVYEGGPKPTDDITEYQEAVKQGYSGTIQDWIIDQKRAGTPKTVGAPQAGYRYEYDDQGNPVQAVPIPGSPAALEAAAAEEQAAMREGASRLTADVVVGAVDTALRQIDENPTATTGLGGQLTNRIGGLPAHDLQNTLNTVKANVGFDKLQKMREASPTGGALGQVSEMELQLLNSALGALEQSQSPEQLKANLARVREIYLDTIHGPGNRPGQADVAPAPQQSGVPQGVDPEDWKYMTPEERALWQ